MKFYEDLFLTENVRPSVLRQGIQFADLSRIRYSAEDKDSTGFYKEEKLNKVYGSKYRTPIDYGILNNHGTFYPKGLINLLVFELRLVPARNVVRGWDLTTNTVTSNCSSGKRFMYEHANHHKVITVKRATDSSSSMRA